MFSANRGFALLVAALLAAGARAGAQETPAPPAPPAAPSIPDHGGWVGIALLANGEGDSGHGLTMKYPVVASVEPGSPARRAGLTPGDTILSFNGVDARDPMQIGRFLTPGTRIAFRVRRGRVREIALRVAERPESMAGPRVQVTMQATELPTMAYAPLAALGPIAIARPSSPHRMLPIAGAQLARITDGLAAALHVSDGGILIVDVAPGTAAMRAGLEPGDVIVRADSITVNSPETLLRAIRRVSDHDIVLTVMRRGHMEQIPLRW